MKPYLLACVCGIAFAVPAIADDMASGVAAYQAGKYRSAFRQLKPYAQQGDAVAQNYLGKMYAAGRLSTMDGVEAAEWFTRAAKQGNAEAQYSLAKMYLSGWGVVKDAPAAVGWLWKSGRQGNLKAQLLLGKLLSEGKVVEQDTVAARLWYAQAASQGSAEAAHRLQALGGAEGLIDMDAREAPEVSSAVARMTPEQRMQQRVSELRAVRPDENRAPSSADPAPQPAPSTPVEAVVMEAAPVFVSADDEQQTAEAAEVVEPEAPAGEGMEELVLEEFSDEAGDDAGDQAAATDDEGEGGEFMLLDDEPELAAEPGDQEQVETVAELSAPVAAASVAAAVAVEPEQPREAAEPVVEASAVEVEAPTVTDEAAVVAEPEVADERATETDIHGREWVLSRPPGHYTIQLLGSNNRADADAFVAANPLPGPGAIVESRRRGKPWFSVFYGDFGKYSVALAAHGKLSGPIAKHGPWLRPFRKIQKGLR